MLYSIQYICIILIGLIQVFLCTSALSAYEKDSLRKELIKTTLTNTDRVKVLEQLVISNMDAHPDSAVYYAWQIYHIAQKDSANINLRAAALIALTNGYQNYDKSDKVLEYGFQLLALSEEMHDTAKMARAFFAIGHASGQLSTKNTHGENISALRYLQQSLAIAKTFNDQRLQTECYNAIGRIYRKEQQFDTAMIYHNQALVLAINNHLPFQQAWALNSLATCYEHKDSLQKALEYALASLKCHKETGLSTIIAIPLNNVARLYQKLDNLSQALNYAQQSFSLAITSQNRAIQYMACERIARIFEAKGDYQQALAYQKRFVAIRDSIAFLERTEDLSKLELSLDYIHSKREKELHSKEDEALKLVVQKQQIIIALIAIGCSLLALATFLLLRNLRSTKLLNEKLQVALSEQSAIKEKFNERGQNLETIIASLDDIIFECNDTFQFQNVWCADTNVLFLKPEEFLGKTFREVFGEEFAQPFESAIIASFASGSVQRIEYTTPFANQQAGRWFEAKIVPIKTQKAETRKATLQVSDITERKRSEEEFQKLSLVASKTTNAVVISDEYGNIEWVNEGFTHLTEFSFSEVVGKKPGQFLKGVNTDAATLQMINEAVQCGKGFEAELLHYTKSKKPIWLHLKADPITNSNGRLTGFILIQTNITERKRVEEQQLQKLSLVASKTTNAVIITNAAGCITWVNEGFTRITEYVSDEVLGKIPGHLLQGEMTDPATVQMMRNALNMGTGFDVEIVNYTKSHRPYWLHIKVDPFYDEHEELAGFVAIETDITKRKQQEILLLESEERYRLIFEHSSEAVLQTLPDGTIEKANPEACRILGRTNEELLLLNRADIVDMTDARLPLYRRKRREKGFVKGELNFVRKDGTIFPGEFSSTVYMDANNSEHIAVFLRDVSERKQAEDAIRKSEARLSTALQALSEGIVIYENGISTQTMNTSALRILGLTKEQLNQQSPLDTSWKTVYEDGRDFPFEEYPLMLTLKTGKPQSNVIMGIHKTDNTQTWISINSRPLIVEDSTEISGVVLSFSDITERKLAEQQLLFQTELLNSIVLSMTDGVVLVEEQRSIVLANPAIEVMFGYTNEQLLAQPLSLLIPHQSHSAHEQHIQMFLDHDTKHSRRKTHSVLGQRKGGETFAIEASIAQFTVDGRLFLLAVVRDITKRLEAEEEILQLNRTLTQRVEERTADLVRLNKEKDEFLSLAAHDLKNPLAAIRSSAQIIEECFIDGEAIDFSEYANSIIAIADEMLEIITNFLDIELIENGKLGLALERLSPEILGRIVDSHRKRAAAKGITIHYEEPPQALFIIADRLALKQVLNNLLSNAVKFSPREKSIVVHVTERWYKSDEQQQHILPYRHVLQIAIRDEGPGISTDEQQNLFVKFARLSAKPTAEEGSTGLGLSIVKRLTEMMNGRVWCESTLGKGATFIVEFPII